MEIKTKDIVEIAVYIFIGYLIAFGANKGLAYALDTNYPVVAVVSTSMEHKNSETYINWFLERNFTEQELKNRPFSRGMRMGDIVVVKGVNFEDVKVGDVIVYKFPGGAPIIHRVVSIEDNSLYTKGDNNHKIDQDDEAIAPPIKEENVQGKAVAHAPLFGYVKLGFIKLTGG